MSGQLVALVEERSMEELLRVILPLMLPESWEWRIIPHRGVSDLEKSLPAKLRAWRYPEARFIVLRDNDRGDCRQRKRRLWDIYTATGRGTQLKVRIVCQELEAWFIGEPEAVGAGLGRIPPAVRKASKDPDAVERPAELLRRAFGSYQKIAGARAIAPHINPTRNQSTSFHQFVAAVRSLTATV